jgi:hypothetical protein
MAHTVLSTGVMIRESDAFNANVVVVNLDPKKDRNVTVEIFDWGVEQLWSAPQAISVSPSGATTVGPHTQRAFIALITQSTTQPGTSLILYEIRVTVDDIKDVVINCYAITNGDQTIPAKTYKHNDLVVIPAL